MSWEASKECPKIWAPITRTIARKRWTKNTGRTPDDFDGHWPVSRVRLNSTFGYYRVSTGKQAHSDLNEHEDDAGILAVFLRRPKPASATTGPN